MSVQFPVITTNQVVTLPEVVAKPKVACNNVRFQQGVSCRFTPHWNSDGTLARIEGEWFWETGKWGQDGAEWVDGGSSGKRNHYIPNLLDPVFAAANPEVSQLASSFAAMVAISKRARII